MICDECGAIAHPDARGEFVCSNCSLVLNNTILDSSPIRTEDNPRPEPTGLNTGISTTRLMNERYDGRGNTINDDTRSKMRRLTWVNDHAIRRKDRSIKRIYALTNGVCSKLSFSPSLRDRTFYLVKKAYEKNVLHNQEFSLLVGGATMIAAREANMYVSVKTLLSVLDISRVNPEKQLRSAYRQMKRALGMYEIHGTASMILSSLDIDVALKFEARRLLEIIQPPAKPEVDAATALFAAARRKGMPMAQVQVAKLCGTNDVSIRARLRKFFPEYVKTKG